MKARLNGVEFRNAIEQATHKICKELSLAPVTVSWDAWTPTAKINNYGDIVLHNVADDAVITRPVFERYVGFILHELLHRKYTDFQVGREEGHYIRSLHNALEDAMIEHRCIDEKLVGNAEGLLSALIDGMVAESATQPVDWTDPVQYPFVLAVYARKHASRKVPLANGLRPIFDVACARIATAKTSQDTLDIAVWVADQLKSIQQPNPNPKPQGEGKGKGEGQPTDGQPQGEGSGEGSGEGEKGSTSPDQGEGEGQGASDGSDDPVGDAKNPMDNEGNLPYAREVEPTNQAPDGAGSDGTYSKTSGLTESHHRQQQSYELNADVNVSAKLRFEVRRLFDNTGTSDHQVGRKSGSVNVRTLHTIPSGNDRLFKRRLDVDGIDSAVVIVLDVSGSMFNFKRKLSPIQAALNACASLVDALNSAQVQTAVLTFGCETAILKPFNLPAKKALAVMPNVVSGGGTNDYFAVRYAHELLHAVDAQRKICFVITDGRGRPSEVRDQVKAGESLGITTIGVGIMSDVTDIYKNAVIVRKVEDLGAIAFNKIKLVA